MFLDIVVVGLLVVGWLWKKSLFVGLDREDKDSRMSVGSEDWRVAGVDDSNCIPEDRAAFLYLFGDYDPG